MHWDFRTDEAEKKEKWKRYKSMNGIAEESVWDGRTSRSDVELNCSAKCDQKIDLM